MIDKDILLAHGGIYKKFLKNTILFNEDDTPRYYYQVLEGSVKMYNINLDGKEFIQGIFVAGDSFGEPPLLIGESYPSSALALTDSIVIILHKDTFIKLLEEYPKILYNFTKVLALRVYNKSITARELVNSSPEMRILAFLTSMKKRDIGTHERKLVPYTRQQIADFTGLRVETVIRTLIKLHEEKKVEIRERKLYY